MIVDVHQRAIGDATMDIIRSEHTKPLNLMEIKVSVTHGMPANYLGVAFAIVDACFYAEFFNKPSMYIDFHEFVVF